MDYFPAHGWDQAEIWYQNQHIGTDFWPIIDFSSYDGPDRKAQER